MAITFTVQAHCDTLDDGYQARIHDPIWLLTRQWQFGELQGEDNGTPTRLQLETEEMPLTRYRGATGDAIDYTVADMPLETLVEREAIGIANSRPLLLLAEAGLHFLRLLKVHGAETYSGAYRGHYALSALPAAEVGNWDADSLRSRQLLTGRAPDAVRLHADFSQALGANGDGGGPLPALPVIAPADQPKIRNAARAWLQWFNAQGFSVPGATAAWVPERMEYSFSVAARNPNAEVVLAAPEYHGGRLDWDTFVGRAGSLNGAALAITTTQHLIPTPVSYRGQPLSRLWAFEDGRVNLGAIADGAPDLATALLIEFALIYGNDWFIAPVETAVGTLSRVKSLTVRDSFNITHTLQHYSAVDGVSGQWGMFTLSPETGAADTTILRQSMLLSPSVGTVLESTPMEEVLFLRDEMANMAWAVERVVAGRGGQPLNRYEQYQAARQGQPNGDENNGNAGVLADLAYKLGTNVPDYWIPFLPKQVVTGGELELRLERAAMPLFGANGGIVGSIPPVGSVLRPSQSLVLYEEEVPREGIRVSRSSQYVRWLNGSTHLWRGTQKLPGRGEGSSGLRFDTVEQI